jgi:hypothetical protein
MNLPDVKGTLGSFVAELRAKRLLPVIGVLVAALIAIPLLLSKSGSAPPPAPLPAVPGGTAAAPGTAVPLSLESTSGSSHLAGSAHDPFIQQKLPAQNSANGVSNTTTSNGATTSSIAPSSSGSTASTGGGSSASGSTPTSSASTGSGSTSSGSTGSGSTGSSGTSTSPHSTIPGPSQPKLYDHVVTVEFGHAGRSPRTYTDVARFTTFPSNRNPAVVFLGVETDQKTAVFLVSGAASPAGDGRCTPNRTHCEFLALKPGDKELVLLQRANGSVTEYQLTYVSVHLVQVKSSAGGVHRVSTSGRQFVHRSARQVRILRQLHYIPGTGLLTERFTTQLIRMHTAARHAGAAGSSVRLVQFAGGSK